MDTSHIFTDSKIDLLSLLLP